VIQFNHHRMPAGFLTRSVSFLIDLVVVGFLVGGMVWVAGTLDRAFERLIDPRISLQAIALVAAPLVALGYYVLLWTLAGRTIGKWLMGLRVVSNTGSTPNFTQSVIRVFGYLLSALLLYLGYLWVLVDRRRMAWHDHLARTHVVYDRSPSQRSLP